MLVLMRGAMGTSQVERAATRRMNCAALSEDAAELTSVLVVFMAGCLVVLVISAVGLKRAYSNSETYRIHAPMTVRLMRLSLACLLIGSIGSVVYSAVNIALSTGTGGSCSGLALTDQVAQVVYISSVVATAFYSFAYALLIGLLLSLILQTIREPHATRLPACIWALAVGFVVYIMLAIVMYIVQHREQARAMIDGGLTVSVITFCAVHVLVLFVAWLRARKRGYVLTRFTVVALMVCLCASILRVIFVCVRPFSQFGWNIFQDEVLRHDKVSFFLFVFGISLCNVSVAVVAFIVLKLFSSYKRLARKAHVITSSEYTPIKRSMVIGHPSGPRR